MTPETARWLLEVVDSLTLNVGAEDFETHAQVAAQAKRDLREIVDGGE